SRSPPRSTAPRSLLLFDSRALALLEGGDDDGSAVLESLEDFFGRRPLLANGERVALYHRQVDEAHLSCHSLSLPGRCVGTCSARLPVHHRSGRRRRICP